MILYHGSPQIIMQPEFGKSKPHNYYGRGFYCTRSMELTKEWACPNQVDGFANQYAFDPSEMDILNLSDGIHHILNWLSLLLKNRTFDLSMPLAQQAREYVIKTFMPDLHGKDVVIGYRADDSCFSFAEDFISGALSLRDLADAMHLGALGEQVVLISPRAFSQIRFTGYEIARYQEYHVKRMNRDNLARQTYRSRKKSLELIKGDLFILDILREEMQNDDPRLQRILPE